MHVHGQYDHELNYQNVQYFVLVYAVTDLKLRCLNIAASWIQMDV